VSTRHEGQDRKSTTQPTPPPPVGVATTRLGAGPAAGVGGIAVEHPGARLDALGADLAHALLAGQGARTLRAIARDVAATAGDDPQGHRTLTDVTVAAQHLRRERALGAYVRDRRRTVPGGGPAAAFLDGMLRGTAA
jgi:hypothetical protein